MPFIADSSKSPPEFYIACDEAVLSEGTPQWGTWVPCDKETARETDPYVAVQASINAGWTIVEDSAYCPTHSDTGQ